MKVILSVLLMFFSVQAMAELPIVGTWYTPYVDLGGGAYTNESLHQIAADGKMTSQYLFPKSSQKIVTSIQSELTSNAMKFITDLVQTNCGKDKILSLKDVALAYSVDSDTLVFDITVNGQLLTLHKASPQQIQKFAAIPEGCN